MSIIFSLIAFFIIFSFLILVHEWGHFFTAKKSGVKVEEFGFGLPPKAKTLFKKGDTEYTLNWIPFGGFVRMLGQSDFDPAGDSKADHNPQSFRNKKYWQKALIISAGVLMNFFSAYVLLLIVMAVGFKPLFIMPSSQVPIQVPSYITPTDTFVNEHPDLFVFETIADESESNRLEAVSKDSIAEKAGIQKGDKILSIDGVSLKNSEATHSLIKERAGNVLNVEIERKTGDQVITQVLTLPSEKDKLLGIQFSPLYTDMKPVHFPLQEIPLRAAEEMKNQMAITLGLAKNLFGNIFTKAEVSKDIAGPIGIVQITSAVAERGFIALLLLTIMLSINLGIMNILPIPALDGGHLLTVTITTLYEKIMKKKPNPKIEATIHGVGFVFLFLLIIVVTFNDIMRIATQFM